MKYPLASMSIAVLLSVACSDGLLTPERAGKQIAGLEEFKREAHFTLRVNTPFQSAFKCLSELEVASVPINRFVVDRGWGRYEQRDGNFGFGTKASCPAMALTPSGEKASAGWRREQNGGGTIWAVPIGQRELVGVTRAITSSEGPTQADFDFYWKWAPNETGSALRQSVPSANALFEATRKDRAWCRRLNEEWWCQLAMWTSAADASGELPH
jgi:hypothetical protein